MTAQHATPGGSSDRACQLLDAWTGPGHQRQVVDIAGCPLAASVMAAAAALEVAVHGWDISRACGQRQPIPRALAAGFSRAFLAAAAAMLLALVITVVTIRIKRADLGEATL